MLHAVIMAGGSGTRFWPLSRKTMPKQLLNLTSDRSMIQMTVDRCEGLVELGSTWVVTNQAQAAATAEQLPGIPAENILIEPVARNTAPCIGLAAMHLLAKDPEAVMLLMPADHVIEPRGEFHRSVQIAESIIANDEQRLALFGVVPEFPSTGFGYIERGPRLDKESAENVYEVSSFREKPDYETAQSYMQQGTFFWNCGIFVWKAQTILDLLAIHQPRIAEPLDEIRVSLGSEHYKSRLAKWFPECSSISIDYAVLEKSENIAVVEASFNWDDVGSWQAMHRLIGTDDNGNTILGAHVGFDTKDCIIRSNETHLITTIGLKNCIIVHTSDATFVADKSDENAIKELIEMMKKQGLERYL
ncbi:MAG TPA: mannose-1-phosphate guanyltransferase [Planctomycetaceae bacterium]|nr:mannose-1-phosphate guanyltransferase [Planctomycetaceae bacterium]